MAVRLRSRGSRIVKDEAMTQDGPVVGRRPSDERGREGSWVKQTQRG